jgi:hypothetical protein
MVDDAVSPSAPLGPDRAWGIGTGLALSFSQFPGISAQIDQDRSLFDPDNIERAAFVVFERVAAGESSENSESDTAVKPTDQRKRSEDSENSESEKLRAKLDELMQSAKDERAQHKQVAAGGHSTHICGTSVIIKGQS